MNDSMIDLFISNMLGKEIAELLTVKDYVTSPKERKKLDVKIEALRVALDSME